MKLWNRSRSDRLKPREPSWGAVLVIVGLVMLLVRGFLVVMVYSHSGSPAGADAARCLTNVRQMSRAIQLYAQDYDGRLPDADSWIDLTLPYNNNEFFYHCPTVQQSDMFAFGYAYNSRIELTRLSSLADRSGTCLIYDSVKDIRNASDPVTSLPYWPRHGAGNTVGFADGHVRLIPSAGVR